MRPGARTGSSPLDASVRKAEAGEDGQMDIQRMPVPQKTGRQATHEVPLKSPHPGDSKRDSPPRAGLPAGTCYSQGGSLGSYAEAAPNPPCPGQGLLAGALPAAQTLRRNQS